MSLNERLIKLTKTADTRPRPGHRSWVRWLPTAAALVAMAMAAPKVGPGWRILLATLVLYLAFKVAAAFGQRHLWSSMSAEAWFWYWTLWPGMDLRGFTRRSVGADAAWLRRGTVGLIVGAALLALAVFVSDSDWLDGWLAVAGLLGVVHFGYADFLSWFMRHRGFNVRRLFVAPERSTSLNDFWSKRWNRAFVEMDLVLFMPILRGLSRRWAPLLMLLVSGLLHELAISYPAGAGWGQPMVYFALHGTGMQLERTQWFKRLTATVGGVRFSSWWTRFWVLAPVSLVFHRPFRDALPLRLIQLLEDLL